MTLHRRTNEQTTRGTGCPVTVAAALGLLLCCGVACPAQEVALPKLQPAWTDTAPVIDGRLEEGCWRAAEAVSSFHAVDGQSRHDDVAWAKVAYDREHLYIAYHIRADPSSNIRGGTTMRDSGVWGGNCVQIFIKPPAGGSFHIFTVNAINTQRDARDSDVGWDAGWQSATFIAPEDDAWQIELAIPYAIFDLHPSAGPDWRLNLTCVSSLKELTRQQNILTWAPTFSNFHQPDRFGHMRLERVAWQRWRYDLKASASPGEEGSFAVVVDADARATQAAPADYDVLVTMIDPAGAIVTQTDSMRLPNPAPPPGQPPKGVARLSLPISAEGRHLFTVRLRHREEGRLVAERRIRADTPSAFEVWTHRSLYTDDPLAVVRIQTSRRSASGRTCRVSLKSAAGAVAGAPVKVAFDPESLRAEATLDSAQVPHGRYRVVVEWEETPEGDARAELAACPLVKAAPQEGMVWYDDRGVLYRDDEPIFPIGMYYIYQEFGDESLRREFAESGFNAVQLGWFTRQHYVDDLNKMKEWGLDLSLAVMNESRFYNARQKRRLTTAEEVAHVADIARVVGGSKPTNLLAYYVQDEPSASDAPRLREWCEAVTANDPYHPGLICLCFKEALRAYADFVDILAPDPYPGFPGGPITKVSDFMMEANRAVRGRKPVLAVLQAFGARGENPVLPTPAELRCMTYLALVHEARGVYYFSYNWNGPLREDHPAQWAELKKLAGEMRDRKDILLAGAGGLAVAAPSFDSPVHARVMETDGGTYLLAVNTQRAPADKVGFQVTGLGSGTLRSVFDDRTREATEGSFTDAFAPLAVHFYRFEEHHAPLSYNIGPVLYLDPATDKESPFFPIGWYHFGPMSEGTLNRFHENGANTAHFGGLGRNSWQKGHTQVGLDHARELGMKVLLTFAPPVVVKVVYGKPETYGPIPDYVTSFKDHPAVLGWQLGDEFSADSAPRANDAAKLIRELGARQQIWQVHSHIESDEAVRALMAGTDVCSYDGYTYHESRPVFAEECSTRILAWQQAKADLIAAEGWAGNVNVTQGYGGGIHNKRFPTYEEYRWNVFSAIASAGARGTLNWIYCHWQGFYREEGKDNPQPFFDFRDRIVKPINLEQQMIKHAMETGYNVGKVRSNLDELTSLEIPPATGPKRKFNRIGHILLHDDQRDEYFLIVTNNEASEHQVRLTLSELPVPPASLTVREPHDNRELQLQDLGGGQSLLEDTLVNHDVAIYVIPAGVK